MAIRRTILLIINIVGGAAVIGSYVLGLGGESGGANALWGGVPEGIRPIYFVSMALSTLGYFAFLYFIFFRVTPGKAVVGGRLGFEVFYAIFLVILIPSALWMPLTNLYVSDPGTGLWVAIRTVLALVGLASIGMLWALLALRPSDRGAAYWAAVAGAGYFAFHTAILDAVIWAALFRR